MYTLKKNYRSPLPRSPSPRRRQMHHDIGFSDTVSNVVEIQKDVLQPHRGARYYHGRHVKGNFLFF
jgi:voltage-dependent calcium channel N type alpha-1B